MAPWRFNPTGSAAPDDHDLQLTFFTKPDCTLCDAAWFVVDKVARAFGVPVEKIDISQPDAAHWHQQYRNDIPVLHLDGVEIFRHRVHERELRALLRSALRDNNA